MNPTGGEEPRHLLQPAIDFPSMPDVVSGYQLGVVIDAVDDPIVSHSDTIQAFCPGQLGRLSWMRSIREGSEPSPDTSKRGFRE